MSMHWTTLVSAEQLAKHIDDDGLRVFDARSVAAIAPGTTHPALLFKAGHIPGAQYADLNNDLSDVGKTGLGRHPLPDSDVFARKLGAWGVEPRHQIVVYDALDGSMAAARMWWLLKLLGHERVAVLDGGLAAWQAAGLPVTTQTRAVDETHEAQAPRYPGTFDESRIVTAADVLARLGEDSGWLVDVRTVERWRGESEPIDPIAGRVPGALNRPFQLNMRDGKFKPASELREELLQLIAPQTPEHAVVMCGSGVTACQTLLAFEHAGLHGARVFAGSWSGWISDAARPIAKG